MFVLCAPQRPLSGDLAVVPEVHRKVCSAVSTVAAFRPAGREQQVGCSPLL